MPKADGISSAEARDHYDAFLAVCYPRIRGGWEEQLGINRAFFSDHSIMPGHNRSAIDLGAGCGFQAVPLAQLGYTVLAADFSRPLLEDLRTHAGSLPVTTVHSDIRQFTSWAAGARPSWSAWAIHSPISPRSMKRKS
jgi:2-polyprenyl-3-methyl-5-hydroxy-6-metoxy-1,4-benzoquinol methylase